jgi:beta-phosphoglucomutase family hydrolase
MSLNFKGVLFDMDGVVVDNHLFHFKAWMTFSQKYQFELNEKIYRESFNGKTNHDLFKMIFGEISDEDIIQYAEEKEGLYRHLYRNEMIPHSGFNQFAEHLLEQGKLIALGTSAPKKNVDFTLDNLNLRKYFQVIVDGHDVKKGKPDPQVYQLAALKLGLDPSECLVFEDSLAGLEAGIRAGCKVIAVATTHQPEELRVKTQYIIKDFIDAMKLLNSMN